jgi:hypothetical protein
MQERRVRLGDILDDYCPRERRITNHAVVAMIDNEVKQTRCVTCEVEHPYRGARVPTRRRKAETPDALFQQVLAARAKTERPPPDVGAPREANPLASQTPPPPLTPPGDPSGAEPQSPAGADPQSAPAPLGAVAAEADAERDEGPVHRPLIRATLPRPEGQQPARPIPQFTIRQLPGYKKLGSFRDGKRGSWATDNGRPPGSASRVPESFRRGPHDRPFGARGRPDKKRPR